MRTGIDDNGDLVFNDRPAGIGRNTLRMPSQYTLNANIGYSFAFGRISGAAAARLRVCSAAAPRRRSHHRTVERPLSAELLRHGAEPDQPRQLPGVQRRDDVAVLRASRPTSSAMRKVDIGTKACGF